MSVTNIHDKTKNFNIQIIGTTKEENKIKEWKKYYKLGSINVPKQKKIWKHVLQKCTAYLKNIDPRKDTFS